MSATALVLILSMLIRNVNIFSVIFLTLSGEQVSSDGICYWCFFKNLNNLIYQSEFVRFKNTRIVYF